MPKKYKDHNLQGNLSRYRELHIKSDLLLIYQVDNDLMNIVLVDIGSHSDLFK